MFSKRLLASVTAISFIASAWGTAQARDYYYFQSIPGSISSTSVAPFDGSVAPEDQGNVSISITSGSISMKSDDTNKVFDFTISTSGGISPEDVAVNFSLENEDVISVSDITVSSIDSSGNGTITIAKAKAAGTVNLTLTAVHDNTQEGVKVASVVVEEAANNAFVTKWTVNSGETVTMPTTSGYNYNGRICWDNENDCYNFTSYNDANLSHTYTRGGTYTVSITGTFEALDVNRSVFSPWLSISSVENMGSVGWRNLRAAFVKSKLNKFTAGNSDTSNVTDMGSMFWNADAVNTIDIKGMDTSKVTNMSSMFLSTHNLVSLDLRGLDTSSVVNMSSMFSTSGKLSSLDLTGFKTSNVTNMSSMFASSGSLIEIDLSSFDTQKVNNMNNMFYGTSSLTSIDLSGFDTRNLIYYFTGGMFSQANGLTNITYSTTVDIAQYANFLNTIFANHEGLKNDVTINVGGNRCGSIHGDCMTILPLMTGKNWTVDPDPYF